MGDIQKALQAMGVRMPIIQPMPWGRYWYEQQIGKAMREGHIEATGVFNGWRIVEWTEIPS